MDQFPRTTVAGISLPRMLIGSNWVLGFSHRTTSADNMIKNRYSNKEAVCDLICAYLEYGVDAMMAPFVGDDMQPNAVVMRPCAKTARTSVCCIIRASSSWCASIPARSTAWKSIRR